MTKYCPECGAKVKEGSKFCGSCGKELPKIPVELDRGISKVKEPKSEILTSKLAKAGSKSPGIAAVLAGVLGLFGVWGIGHIYISKLSRGVVLLVSGLMLEGILWYFVLKFFSSCYLGPFDLMIFYLISLIGFVVWICQTYNAYTLAKKFNKHLKEYGEAPW